MTGKSLLRRAGLGAIVGVAILAVAYRLDHRYDEPQFLKSPEPEFVALFAAPPAPDSAQARRELDELLAIQQRRTTGEIEAARADRKTEVWQFAAALGLQPEQMRDLDALNDLAEQMEDDVRPYVRAAKHHFLRRRPYEIEARLKPCIDNVRGDLSYPSGHATYGYVTALLLSDLVPERRTQIMARAQEFARQRMVCGVHFPSDIEAGRRGAEWLAQRLLASPEYRAGSAPARAELRNALNLVDVTPTG